MDFKKLGTFIVLIGVLSLSGYSESNTLRTGMEYQCNSGSVFQPATSTYLFSSTFYVFGKQGVSVSKVISDTGDIFRSKKNGKFMDSSTLMSTWLEGAGGRRRGTSLSAFGDTLDVVLGPGDRMPVLINAPYKIVGTSVYIDWSQAQSQFFHLSSCNSGSEVLTIKNDGLVLESATQTGFVLTLNMNAVGTGSSKEGLAREDDAPVVPVKKAEIPTPDRTTANGNIDWDTLPVEVVRRLAEANDPVAQNKLGYLYANGRGVPKDETEAVKWYRKSAAQGNADYAMGKGVPKDEKEAFAWCCKAAEQGHKWAQCNLGKDYELGRGVAQDMAEAIRWYRKAAEQGYDAAIKSLARLNGSNR